MDLLVDLLCLLLVFSLGYGVLTGIALLLDRVWRPGQGVRRVRGRGGTAGGGPRPGCPAPGGRSRRQAAEGGFAGTAGRPVGDRSRPGRRGRGAAAASRGVKTRYSAVL